MSDDKFPKCNVEHRFTKIAKAVTVNRRKVISPFNVCCYIVAFARCSLQFSSPKFWFASTQRPLLSVDVSICGFVILSLCHFCQSVCAHFQIFIFPRLVCSSVRKCRFLFLFVVFTSFYAVFVFALYCVLPEWRNKQLKCFFSSCSSCQNKLIY